MGGSSGGSSSEDGSGAGGGAISLRAAGHLQIEPNVYLTANGGDGIRSSASGSGGSIRLEGQTIANFGFIEATAGHGVQIEGTNQNRGSAGGRVAFHAIEEVTVGKVNVSGEWLSNEGSIFVGGDHFASSLDMDTGTLTFDTGPVTFLWKEVPMAQEWQAPLITQMEMDRTGVSLSALSLLEVYDLVQMSKSFCEEINHW